MDTRDLSLLALRPELPNVRVDGAMSSEEHFQNNTLRPVIKLQNDLLVAVFKNYIKKHKNVFQTYTVDKRLDYIDNAIQRDIKFRNSLKGIVIGHFTAEEYSKYIDNSSALNKRMMNLVKERLKSNIQLLEPVLRTQVA
ncbi:MAG: hypothetical protein ACI825_001060 [Planctomycetota bacterium]|jgi:hypothetical protein|uniref:glyoxalase n=1 Tax=Patiriisocius sp. Uisw_047 TaxID=3230969 RepID=UPI0039E9D985